MKCGKNKVVTNRTCASELGTSARNGKWRRMVSRNETKSIFQISRRGTVRRRRQRMSKDKVNVSNNRTFSPENNISHEKVKHD
jgi:hypothetical protein